MTTRLGICTNRFLVGTASANNGKVSSQTSTATLTISRADLVGRALGISAILGSLTLPWVQSRSLGNQSNLRFIDLSTVHWIFITLLVVLAGSTISQMLTTRFEILHGVDAVIAATLILVPIFAVALLDVLAIWLYPSFLPSTLRRLIVGVTPQGGIWLAIIGAGLIVLSVLELSHSALRIARRELRRLAERDVSALAAPLLLVGVPLSMDARYQPWLELNSKVGQWSLPGFAIPFLGILTLVIFAMALAGGIVAFVSPRPSTGVVLVISGWLLTLPSSIFLAIASRRFSFVVPSIIRNHLRQWSTTINGVSHSSIPFPSIPNHLAATIQSGRGLILCCAAGAMIALAGVFTCRGATKESA